MKALVVYSSRTGNTRKVAEAVHGVLPAGSAIYPVEEAPASDDFDFVALGFWVNKGMPDAKAQEYMKRMKGKAVGLFGTLGAWPDSDHARDCMEKARQFVEEGGNRVVCRFMCMGRVDPRLVEAMQKAPDAAARHPMTPERKARLEEAARHPDEKDLADARRVFAETLGGHSASVPRQGGAGDAI